MVNVTLSRSVHVTLFEYQLINIVIFGGVKFLLCLIILHFLCNDLEQEVTKFMIHNHHGAKVNYTHNMLSNMYYMFSVIDMLLIISGIELNPGPIDNRTFLDSSTCRCCYHRRGLKRQPVKPPLS
jgi:hypothetical protein